MSDSVQQNLGPVDVEVYNPALGETDRFRVLYSHGLRDQFTSEPVHTEPVIEHPSNATEDRAEESDSSMLLPFITLAILAVFAYFMLCRSK